MPPGPPDPPNPPQPRASPPSSATRPRRPASTCFPRSLGRAGQGSVPPPQGHPARPEEQEAAASPAHHGRGLARPGRRSRPDRLQGEGGGESAAARRAAAAAGSQGAGPGSGPAPAGSISAQPLPRGCCAERDVCTRSHRPAP